MKEFFTDLIRPNLNLNISEVP